MEHSLQLAGFENRNLLLKQSFFSSIPKIYIDGNEVQRSRKTYLLRNNQGDLVELKIRPKIFDPIPEVYISGEKIEFVRSLTWYEYLWMSIPIILVFIGGAIGGALGFIAAYSSSKIFRSEISILQKYLLSGVISISSILIYFLISYYIQILLQ